jgi:hypothetical protein
VPGKRDGLVWRSLRLRASRVSSILGFPGTRDRLRLPRLSNDRRRLPGRGRLRLALAPWTSCAHEVVGLTDPLWLAWEAQTLCAGDGRG